MKYLKTVLEITIIAVVFAFVFGVFVPIFWKIGDNLPIEASTTFVGAFLGAFLSYLFVRIGIALDNIYSRHAKHRTALIKSEHKLNSALNVIADNIFVVDKYIEIFDGYNSNSEPRVFGNVFHPIPYDESIVIELANVDFINQLFGLHVDFRKLNDSMDTINRMVGKTTDAFVQHHIDHNTYVANIDHNRPQHTEIRQFLEAAAEDTIKTISTARVLCKSETPLSKIIRWTLPANITNKQRKEIKAEISILKSEIDINAQEHKKRIDEIKSNEKSNN